MKKISKELMAETISAKRKEKNLSQSALAEITGINRSMTDGQKIKNSCLP